MICSAERLLKEGGFSIPNQYTSYLSPITCSHAYNKVSSLPTNLGNPFEMGHLIAFKRFYLPSKILPCFEFQHPFKETEGLKRFSILEFPFAITTQIHGLVGYFSSNLFGETTLSICPLNKTKEMFSWFPIFFPFESPLILNENLILRINFGRFCSKKEVWYEWQPEIFLKNSKEVLYQGKIYNLKGKSFSIQK